MHTWWPRAACNSDPRFDMWAGKNDRQAIAYNQQVCARCPVRADCLRYGLSTVETVENGMWGGLLREDRRRLHREGWHDTLTGYNRGCRCLLCRDTYRRWRLARADRDRDMAKARRRRQQHARKQIRHRNASVANRRSRRVRARTATETETT